MYAAWVRAKKAEGFSPTLRLHDLICACPIARWFTFTARPSVGRTNVTGLTAGPRPPTLSA